MENYSFQIVEKYPNITIIHHRTNDGTIWATSGRNILFRKNGDWQPYSRFPFCFPRDLFAFSHPSARVMRSDKCNLFVNSRGNVLGIRGSRVYAFLPDQPPKVLFTIQGDCVLHRSIAEDQNGWAYFGEYFMNPQRYPVHIWRVSPELDRWEIAYEFKANSIRHVHGIYLDPYEPATFWVTVGDFSGESHLLCSDDTFKSVQQYGDGSQNWRAVNIFFTKDFICWLTDSNLEQNHAMRMNRKTGELEKGQEIDCSTWYGGSTHEDLHVAFTTVERGPAIHSNLSTVLISEDAFHWQEVFRFKKDFYRPVQLFKYGVISCPGGEMSLKELYLSGEGLVGLDGCSIQARIERKIE